MIKKIFLVVSLLLATLAHAQDFRAQFNEALQNKDTVAQKKALAGWEKSKKADAELYIAKFNFYFSNSRTEVLQLGQNPNGKEALALQDSLGKTSAYLYQGDNIGYNSKKVALAKKIIDEAISKFPDRLDLRFGKVYMLGELQQWQPFTDEIVRTLDRSSKNRNAWKWRDDKPVEDVQKFLIGNVQSYFNQLYDTEDDALLANMQTISETVLQYYPNDVMNLSNLGAIKLMKSDFNGALPLFLKAEKLSPDDSVVINNIALCYERKGDKKNAVVYYSKLLDKADAQTKAKIEARISKINE